MEHLPMASESLLFVAFGVALFYLKLNPAPVRDRDLLRYAWFAFFADMFLVLFFAIFRAWNSSAAEAQNYKLADIWASGISWTVFTVGVILLYRALTPFTSKPEKSADGERRGRRGREESDREEDAEREERASDDRTDRAEADRRSSRTPMEGSRLPSRRFGMGAAEEKFDPALEAKVEDELSAEPELVLSKEDELSLGLPPLEDPKVKTVSAAVSGSQAPAIDRAKSERAERPKTERPPRPRSEINPAVKKSGISPAVPSGSRTNIPVADGPGSPAVEVLPGEPVTVPVASPASRSGSRPAASGIRPAASGVRPAAKSGTVKTLPANDPPDTPSKDQYLEK